MQSPMNRSPRQLGEGMTICVWLQNGYADTGTPRGQHGSLVKPADRHGTIHVDIAALRPTGGQGLAIKRLVVSCRFQGSVVGDYSFDCYILGLPGRQTDSVTVLRR